MGGDFKIGEWLVSPALNQISRNGGSTRVEPKSMHVLVYLAEHPGVVSKEQLISAVWPDVFVSDDVLPGCVSALRKAFDDNARRPKIIETIHKSGYRLLLPVEAVKRNGDERTEAGARDESWWRRSLSGRTLVITSIASFSAILITVTAWLSSRPRYDSVAILPFRNVGEDSATQYLSDGVAEQVVNDLSQLSTLKVMAWTTVSRYRQPQIDVRAAGRDLGVKAVLVGHLVRDGDHIVLDAELVNVEQGSQLWGQRYERNMSNISGLQQQLSRDIATNLRVRLAGGEQNKLLHHYNASPAAYELYLKGRFFSAKRTKQGLEQGVDYFQQAIRVDPNYALAYAGLADCYILLDDWGETAPRDSFPQARASAEKAIALDDSLGEAHVSLAMVRELYDWDWVGAEQEFKHAIELNPNYPTAHQWYGLMLANLGRFPEAEAEVKRAQQLDPLSPIINMAVAEVYTWERRYDESIEQYKKVIVLDPSFSLAYDNVANAYEQKHRYNEAVSAIQQKWDLSGDPSFAREIERAYSRSGYPAVIRQELSRSLQERAKGQYADPVDIAGCYAELGDEADAFQWLQRAYEEHSSGMRFLGVLPDFDRRETFRLRPSSLVTHRIMTLRAEQCGTPNAHKNLELSVKTILLVEDSRFLRLIAEKTLVRAGYKVVSACDGEEALRMAAETAPHLVLLDMLLPKLSGNEVLRTLRSTPQTASIPIVVLSSLPQSNERKLKRDGATAYFDKSSLGLHEHSDSLIQIVNKMLGETKEDREAIGLPPLHSTAVPAKGEA